MYTDLKPAMFPDALKRGAEVKSRLSASTIKHVLLCLSVYSGRDQYCYPSLETLSQASSLSLRSVKEILGTLEDYGYITIGRRKDWEKLKPDEQHQENNIAFLVHPENGVAIDGNATRSRTHRWRKPAQNESTTFARNRSKLRQFDNANYSDSQPRPTQFVHHFDANCASESLQIASIPQSIPYIGSTNFLEAPLEVPELEVPEKINTWSERVSTPRARAPKKNFSTATTALPRPDSLAEQIATLWKLPQPRFRNARDVEELRRAVEFCTEIGATFADVEAWRARWDKPRQPYLSQLNDAEWSRLMSNWVSAAELERREAASRKAEAKAAREAEQQRTQNQAREREDAALDARYGALPAEAKAALDAVVLADLGGAISFLKRRPPETVMQGYRREKLRAGWRHDPAAPPPRREYSDLETPGRGTSAPRPDPREKSDWQLVPDTTPEQALARQRELAIARGASPDILAALGVLP